ncbi:hypothetical protein ACJX0J_037871, partial [Zea mays]
ALFMQIRFTYVIAYILAPRNYFRNLYTFPLVSGKRSYILLCAHSRALEKEDTSCWYQCATNIITGTKKISMDTCLVGTRFHAAWLPKNRKLWSPKMHCRWALWLS